MDIFPEVVIFSNEYIFELLMQYWLGFLVQVYTTMASVHRKLKLSVPENTGGAAAAANSDGAASSFSFDSSSSSGDSPLARSLLQHCSFSTFDEVEHAADRIAKRVCQSVAFCQRAPDSRHAGLSVYAGALVGGAAVLHQSTISPRAPLVPGRIPSAQEERY